MPDPCFVYWTCSTMDRSWLLEGRGIQWSPLEGGACSVTPGGTLDRQETNYCHEQTMETRNIQHSHHAWCFIFFPLSYSAKFIWILQQQNSFRQFNLKHNLFSLSQNTPHSNSNTCITSITGCVTWRWWRMGNTEYEPIWTIWKTWKSTWIKSKMPGAKMCLDIGY